jgi:hypothetical protein
MDGEASICDPPGDGLMPDRRSKVLKALAADIERADRPSAADKAIFAKLSAQYPHLTREPVFCWLWDNHEQVDELRNWRGTGLARVGWDELAKIMAEDGVVGSRGLPPNGNSVRRVWARVQRNKAERAKRESAKAAGQ